MSCVLDPMGAGGDIVLWLCVWLVALVRGWGVVRVSGGGVVTGDMAGRGGC